MQYPARCTYQKSAENYAVRFPDIPDAMTLGESIEEAMMHAVDALETALDFYFETKRSFHLLPLSNAVRN